MSPTLSQTTRTAPNYGVETSPEPVVNVPRSTVPQGFRAWLPALVVLIGMPLLALATTKYVLLPSVKQALARPVSLPIQSAVGQGASTLLVAKIPLNITGIRGLGLLGADKTFKDTINQNKARLAGLAASDLDGVTASDLYKPEVLNPIRGKILADFNQALGGPIVKEVFIALTPPEK